MIKFLLLLIPFSNPNADTLTPSKPSIDTTVLENIIVRAYEGNRRLIEVPAAVSLLQTRDLNRYNNATIVEAVNVSPGVRMEERSPGSYRFNIRGSSLRSPFGVRNVKIYLNGIPFTDPGGNSYLNQLDFYNVESAEIIKGPAGSIYGAGTGGVLLLNSSAGVFKPGISLQYTAGSYHMHHVNAEAKFENEHLQNTVNYSHISSDGYRHHTKMRRDAVSWQASVKETNTTKMDAFFFFGDMYYQTPGALTKAEYEKDPRSARPATGMNPSANEAKAHFKAQTFLSGFSVKTKISESWQNGTSVYGAYSQNRNPNFRNFSRTSEPHFGARTVFTFEKKFNETKLRFNGGGELQKSFNTQRVYQNQGGEPGILQTDDEIFNTAGFGFAQVEAEVKTWIFTLAASVNESLLKFRRLSGSGENEDRNFKNEVAPRVAVLKKINEHSSAYFNIAKGFSAPATSELLPSTDVFNTSLEAETGINYEVGYKGMLPGNMLFADVNVFYYRLNNAIVQFRDASGGDYFKNAGTANQKGVELFLNSILIENNLSPISFLQVYVSNTLFDFKYKNYETGGKNYSGNHLPGVASHTVAAGIDLKSRGGLFGNISYFHSSKIALNDANEAWASPYDLLGFKIGYDFTLRNSVQAGVFGGGQNLLNVTYSLGNDINAFGGRYYNAAAGRNFYVGFHIRAW